MNSRKEEAAYNLGLAVKYVGSVSVEAKKMVSKKISKVAFIRDFKKELEKFASGRSADEYIERVSIIHAKKDDLANFKNTGWGWYNSVADLVSNAKPLRQTENYQVNKLVDFFDGNKILQTAQRVLQGACLIFCVIGKLSFERDPFIAKFYSELIQRRTPVMNWHGPFF
jgi:hypothetical protein